MSAFGTTSPFKPGRMKGRFHQSASLASLANTSALETADRSAEELAWAQNGRRETDLADLDRVRRYAPLSLVDLRRREAIHASTSAAQ
jgi:hypothetical protein